MYLFNKLHNLVNRLNALRYLTKMHGYDDPKILPIFAVFIAFIINISIIQHYINNVYNDMSNNIKITKVARIT